MRALQFVLGSITVLGAALIIYLVGLNAQIVRVPPEEYEFVEDTSRWVEVIQGETVSVGKLDSAGNFIPNKRYFQLIRGAPTSGVQPGTPINAEAKIGVYEFRSGRLIPGDIDDNGNFIPTLGAKIIDFNDYHYSPKAPKIYNLPGKFVKKEKKDGQK